MIKFQVIISVFQSKNIFLLCIKSLFMSIKQPTEIILINDGSNFNCMDSIYDNFSVPDNVSFQYFIHPTSIGFALSINQGIQLVHPDTYVVFADSDIIFCNNWQDEVTKTLADSTIGAVGGVLIYPQTGGIQCCGITYMDKLARHLYLNNKLSNLNLPSQFSVQATIFAFFAAKSNVILETGNLDEQYFNGYEDIDYQLRIRQHGYKIVTNTNLILYHFEKSNGVHRQYSRRQNLGIFWSQNSNFVKNDLEEYLEYQLRSHSHSLEEYILVNMCEATMNAGKIIKYLETKFHIVSVLDVSNLCTVETKIWFPEILSSDSYAVQKSYIFLCDNFIELTENSYWINLRKNYSSTDIIIDLYANVIPLLELVNVCWPGNKIR